MRRHLILVVRRMNDEKTTKAPTSQDWQLRFLYSLGACGLCWGLAWFAMENSFRAAAIVAMAAFSLSAIAAVITWVYWFSARIKLRAKERNRDSGV